MGKLIDDNKYEMMYKYLQKKCPNFYITKRCFDP
jgi:hypothetical protein